MREQSWKCRECLIKDMICTHFNFVLRIYSFKECLKEMKPYNCNFHILFFPPCIVETVGTGPNIRKCLYIRQEWLVTYSANQNVAYDYDNFISPYNRKTSLKSSETNFYSFLKFLIIYQIWHGRLWSNLSPQHSGPNFTWKKITLINIFQ